MSYTYKYPRPAVTADAVVFRKTPYKPDVLLIKRANPPFEGMWCLPGGFMDMDETPDEAALRELKEETGLDAIELHQFHTFGAINRDPRYRTISIVYTGVYHIPGQKVQGGDDATEAAWFQIDQLPNSGFDHREIIEKAYHYGQVQGWF